MLQDAGNAFQIFPGEDTPGHRYKLMPLESVPFVCVVRSLPTPLVFLPTKIVVENPAFNCIQVAF